MRQICGVILYLLWFSANIIQCDVCVVVDFENGLQGNFTNDEMCANLNIWMEGSYSFSGIESPHPKSEHFIAPTSFFSCVTSRLFEMVPVGVLEVNAYMESHDPNDEVVIYVHEKLKDDTDLVMGFFAMTSLGSDFANGWHTLRIQTSTPENFNGYITLMGRAAPESIVLIDSLRYITPSSNAHWCQIYEDDQTTTNNILETTTTTTTTTEDITTTETLLESTTDSMFTVDTTLEPTIEPLSTTMALPEYTTDFLVTTENEQTSSDTTITEAEPRTSTQSEVDSTSKVPEILPDDKGFGTLLIFIITVVLALIIIVITAFLCYQIGKKRGKRGSII